MMPRCTSVWRWIQSGYKERLIAPPRRAPPNRRLFKNVLLRLPVLAETTESWPIME
jgi:hypothetical protein